MKDYNGWPGKLRDKVGRQIKRAIEKGELAAPSKCERCGQTEGTIDYHTENYGDAFNNLEQLCYKCHRKVHDAERFPEACARYWEDIRLGKVFPPVYMNRGKKRRQG